MIMDNINEQALCEPIRCGCTSTYVGKELYVTAGTTWDEELLRDLARSELVSIRMRVAENPRTPLFTLLLLSRDPRKEVRLALIENPKVTYSIVCNLAKDDDVDIRYALAENPFLPVSVLCFLCEDDNPYVAWRAHLTTQKLFPEEATPIGQWDLLTISA